MRPIDYELAENARLGRLITSQLTCSVYPGTGWPRPRCAQPATHRLVQPDGQLNRGGHVCREHGEEILAEYAEKLGEIWTLMEST